MKFCPTCKVEKSEDKFFKASGKSDGLQSCCKECHKARMQSYQKKLSETSKKIPSEKLCPCCKTVLPASSFAFAKNQKSGLSPWCRVCMKGNRKRKRENDPASFLLISAKSRAKSLGVPFNLEKEDIQIPKFCPVLGNEMRISDGYQKDCSPSLDRIKPDLGYVKGNVKVISWRANRLKADGAIEDFQKIVDYLSMHSSG